MRRSFPLMVAGRSAWRGLADGVVPGRAAVRCQPESGVLTPEGGRTGGRRFIEKARSEDRWGHSP